MSRRNGYPTAWSHVSGSQNSLQGSLPACLSDEDDTTGIFFGRGPNEAACEFNLTTWNLSNRNASKPAQSYNIILRARALLTNTNGKLVMTITMGGGTIQQAIFYCPSSDYEIQDNFFRIPNTTAYWNGTAAININCKYIPNDITQATNGKLVHVELFYGEADGFVDVTANTSYELPAASWNGGIITNPSNAANGTATFATLVPASSTTFLYFNFLTRRIPAFTLPANTIFSGVECWDILSENVGGGNPMTALLLDAFTISNYPASSPDANTPRSTVSYLADPSFTTMEYPGQTELVYFAGPGDLWLSGGANGWTGIDLSRLLNNGYEFRSQIVTFGVNQYGGGRGASIYMRDLKVRAFYDTKAVAGGPSLMHGEV